MLELYRNGRFETLGDVSPFIYKLETYMRMAEIPFEVELMPVEQLLQTGPRNLIPFVDDDGERLGDSSLIIEHLQDKHGDPLGDRALAPEQEHLAHLIKKLCEHELFYIMIYSRWLGSADYASIAKFLNRQAPAEQLPQRMAMSREAVNSMLHGYRLGRYDEDFVEGALRKNLDCLSFYLGDKPFLFGDTPHMIDAIIYSLCASFIDFPLPNKLVGVAREYGDLVAHCGRIKERYFPPEAWADPV